MPYTAKSACVGQITCLQPHPNSDTLDVVTVRIAPEHGHEDHSWTNVANRREDGSPRYAVGDFAVVLVENLILPDSLIRHLHMWDTEKNRGGLAGSKGNRTRARRVAGVVSEVALCAVDWHRGDDHAIQQAPGYVMQQGIISIALEPETGFAPVGRLVCRVVNLNDPEHTTISPEGFDMTDDLGITLYTPQA